VHGPFIPEFTAGSLMLLILLLTFVILLVNCLQQIRSKFKHISGKVKANW